MADKLGIPAATWNDIYREFVEGKSTLAQLAAKHGLKQTTIENRARGERWGIDRRLFAERAKSPRLESRLPVMILKDSDDASQAAASAFQSYQSRAAELDELASIFVQDCRDALTVFERAAAMQSLDRCLERLRIVLRIPLVAPLRPIGKPVIRSLDISPLAQPSVAGQPNGVAGEGHNLQEPVAPSVGPPSEPETPPE
jgi:hypothetical protein